MLFSFLLMQSDALVLSIITCGKEKCPKGQLTQGIVALPAPQTQERWEKVRKKAIWYHYPKYQTILFFPDCEMGSLPFYPKYEKVAHSFQKSI